MPNDGLRTKGEMNRKLKEAIHMPLNEAKHTKEPWVLCRMIHAVCETWGIKGEDTGNWIAQCHPFNGDAVGQEEAWANARLIAAAPELLEALETVVERMEELQKVTSYPLAWPRVKAMDAIAKAKGGIG